MSARWTFYTSLKASPTKDNLPAMMISRKVSHRLDDPNTLHKSTNTQHSRKKKSHRRQRKSSWRRNGWSFTNYKVYTPITQVASTSTDREYSFKWLGNQPALFTFAMKKMQSVRGDKQRASMSNVVFLYTYRRLARRQSKHWKALSL